MFPQKNVIRASRNSDYKTGAATNRVAFATAPFPIPRAEKAEPKLKRLLSPPFPANFIIAYKPYRGYVYYIDKLCLCQLFKTHFVYNFNMDKIITIKFAERLRELRKDDGLSQTKLAEKLGVTQRKISYWERGDVDPDMYSLWKISDFFEVSVDYLIGKID